MKQGWKTFWEFYLIFFGASVLIKTIGFYKQDSEIQLYFSILKDFDSRFWFGYLLNSAEVWFSWVQVIAVSFYTYEKNILPKPLWKTFFFLKIILLLVGNSYLYHFIYSSWHVDLWAFILTISLTFIPLIPAYWALWKYAFKKN